MDKGNLHMHVSGLQSRHGNIICDANGVFLNNLIQSGIVLQIILAIFALELISMVNVIDDILHFS